jgi:adenosine deaminase
MVTVNSDDPAYFGGYIGRNYEQVSQALGLSEAQIVQLARNGFEASFLPGVAKKRHLAAIDAVTN